MIVKVSDIVKECDARKNGRCRDLQKIVIMIVYRMLFKIKCIDTLWNYQMPRFLNVKSARVITTFYMLNTNDER